MSVFDFDMMDTPSKLSVILKGGSPGENISNPTFEDKKKKPRVVVEDYRVLSVHQQRCYVNVSAYYRVSSS